jgi:predicted O-methyltransferase YrrM
MDKDAFAMGGELPKVPNNVHLNKGWFDATLPGWLAANPGPIALIHIDCDIYSSTKTIFDLIADRIAPNTIIVFDEYFGYPRWQDHEFKAFQEFVAAHGVRYEYLTYARIQTAVKIISVR